MPSVTHHIVGSLLLTACAVLHASPDDQKDRDSSTHTARSGAVAVHWGDPAQFTEVRLSNNRFEALRGNWADVLAQHLADKASPHVPAGQSLTVELEDIDLAGDFEPWAGPRLQDVRMIRDIYPPRLQLAFAVKDSQGKIISQGQRRLGNTGYLHDLPATRSASDSLLHEKRLIDRWVRDEFAHATTGE